MARTSLLLYFFTIFISNLNLIYAESFIESFTKNLESLSNSISSTSQEPIPQVKITQKNIHKPSTSPSPQTLDPILLNKEFIAELNEIPTQSSSDHIETLSQSTLNSSPNPFLSDKSTFLSSEKDLVRLIKVSIPKNFTSFYLFTIKVELIYEYNTKSYNTPEEVMIDSNISLNGAKSVNSIENIAYFKLFTNQTGPALFKIKTYLRVFIFHIFIQSPVASVIMEAKMVF